MKRRIISLLLVLALCLGMLPAASAAVVSDDDVLCKAFHELYPRTELSSIHVAADYGTFSGWRVVIMDCDEWADTTDVRNFEIAGYHFTFSSSAWGRFLAYCDGKFLTVEEAYKTRCLSASDIEAIYEARTGNTGSIYSTICAAYAERNPYAIAEKLYVERDYGVCNGWRIVTVMEHGIVMTADVLTLNIADYIFTFSSGGYRSRFLAYRDGKLLTVADAYDKGLLREEDVAALYDTFIGNNTKCAKAITEEELVDAYREYVLRYTERIELAPEEVRLQKDFGLLGQNHENSKEGPYRIVWLSRSDGRNHTPENGLSFRDGDDLYWVPDTDSGEELLLAYRDGFFIPLNELLSPDSMPTFTAQEKADLFRNFWNVMGTPFRDVPEDAWYHDAVGYTYANRLMNGVSDELFAPDSTMTRAMLVTVLWRANSSSAGYENKFTDVPDDLWYTDAVAWASAFGIVNGVGDGKFAPNDPITREQFVTILYRLSEAPDTAPDLGIRYCDTDKISEWAVPAMRWAVDHSIIEGTEDASRKGSYYLNPAAYATRAQAAAILMRYQAYDIVPMATDLTAGLTAADLPALPKVSEEAADAIADFSVDVFKKAMSGEENTVLSPLSLLYALAMLANGAEEDTRAELEAAFGMSVEEMNEALYNLRAILCGYFANVNLANSIWIRDSFAGNVKSGFLQADMEYYDAAVFAAPFDQLTVDDINAWVKKNTDGMIPKLIDELTDDTVMALVNALLFESSWENEYSDTFSEPFYAYDGSTKTVDMLKSCENIYLEDENAVGFRKALGDCYDFAVIVPKEGVDLRDYVASLDGESLRKLLAGSYVDEVHATMPEFKAETVKELSDVLYDMGVQEVFSDSRSNLHGIAEQPLYVSEVLQRAKIDVNQKGVSAAAATVIAVETRSVGPAGEPVIKYVTADHPYLYMIIDTNTRLPLFIGTNLSIHSVKEEIAEIRAGVEEVKREAFLHYIAALDPSTYVPGKVLVTIKDTTQLRDLEFTSRSGADCDSFRELLGIDFPITGAYLLSGSAELVDGKRRMPEIQNPTFCLSFDDLTVPEVIERLMDNPFIESVSPDIIYVVCA